MTVGVPTVSPDAVRPEAVSAEAVARLCGLPGFDRAMRAAVRSAVELYRGDRLLNALMNDRARALFGHAALYLHYAADAHDGPGLSVGAMKDICAQVGLCSRGRTEAMLALMRAGGLLAAAPSLDRRRRLLVPTEKLMELHRTRWGAQFQAMSAVLQRAAAYHAALDDPAFIRAFVLELGRRFIAGLRVLDAAPDLGDIAERNAGVIILYALSLEGRADDAFPPRAPVPLSINALAVRFSVSRKHVLTLLRDCEARGLLERGGRANDEITFLGPGRDALERMSACMFLYMADCAEVAMVECGRG